MHTPVILLDLDDTLLGVRFPDGTTRPVASAYEDCIRQFADRMALMGYNPVDARALQQRIDIDLVTQHGFGDRTRFGHSFVETYRTLAGTHARPEVEAELAALGMTVFTHYPYVPFAGVHDTLDRLRGQYAVHVVTKGDVHEQARKMRMANLLGAVTDCHIVHRKDEKDWNWVLARVGLTCDICIGSSWAIGNSAKADVNPLVARGLNGLHLQGTNSWSYEMEPLYAPLPGRTVAVVSDIRDILTHVLIRWTAL